MAQKQKFRRTLNILEKSKKQSQFDYTEVFRHIRTNIEFSNVDNPIKSIAITSSQPGEAKSTTSMNLAFIFAAKYQKVLIIDCDLRKTMLHKYMKLSNSYGLLYVLTAGIHVPNPSELLSSDTFKDYMKVLKQNFDFIIIDCAPIGAISDAIPVGNAVDGTIFVVSAKDTKRKDAAQCVDLLKRSNVNVIGSVLTKADSGSGSYHYYY